MKRASGGLGTGTLLLLYYRARQANSTIVIKCKYFNNYNRYEVVTFMGFKFQYFINLVMQKKK